MMEAFRLPQRSSVMSLFLLLCGLLCSRVASQECMGKDCTDATKPPLKFEDIVPKHYDKLVPPVDNGEAAVVRIKVSVLNIQFVDEVAQAFGADIFIHQIWSDPRVKIPEAHATSRLVLDTKWRHNLWTPDIFFKTILDGKVNDIIIPYSYMVVDNRSNLFFATRMSLKLSCEMDLASYPHDVQECNINVMSLQHTTDTVILKWQEFEITKNILLAQYYVSGHTNQSITKHYNVGNFSNIIGKIQLARRLGYFLINKYIPCVLIVCMSFVTFWIPAEAYPARVTLSVTSLLTIVTQQYQHSMPSVSYVVALNIWILSCIGFVFFSLLEYAVVIAVMNNTGTTMWPFRKMKAYFSRAKTPTAADGETGNCFNHSPNSYSPTTEQPKPFSHQTIDKSSRLLFPLFFGCFCICYFSYFCR